jgi:hypothetical protein
MALRRGDGVGHVVRDHLGCKTRVSDKPVATDCIKERGNRRRSEAGVRETDVVCVEVMAEYKIGLATCMDWKRQLPQKFVGWFRCVKDDCTIFVSYGNTVF